ncbi:MAG TPA: class II fructose-bisphosphatase [Streptosporangiaceae bacterium]|nr:class II fructose-bisphosphatase [Streptosporangiaceae bacterium]
MSSPGAPEPDRNLALELVRATESAALAAADWVGRGEKEPADQAAVDGMRSMLSTVSMRGTVVIGEGEKDEAPMLYNGEEVGSGAGPAVDVAVDPLEGTELTALGLPNAVSVIAVAERGSMFAPVKAFYMEKIVTGRAAAAAISLLASPAENVRKVAEALGKRPADVTVVVLNRERNAQLVAELRAAGAKVSLIPHGDTAPAIATALRRCKEPVDLVMGIGGSTEGIIAAAAVKCLGGAIQVRLWPRDAADRERLAALRYPLDRVLGTDDLVAGDDVFVAVTGVTSGALLQGVREFPGGFESDSLVIRSRSGTVRHIESDHTVHKPEHGAG